MLQLLTTKPVLYVCNVEEDSAGKGNSQSARVAEMAVAQGNSHVVISARIEEEISQLDDEEAQVCVGILQVVPDAYVVHGDRVGRLRNREAVAQGLADQGDRGDAEHVPDDGQRDRRQEKDPLPDQGPLGQEGVDGGERGHGQ